MMYLFHPMSLLLGILALAAGGMAVKTRANPGWLAGSFACCGGALLCQLFELARLAECQEASGIFDTAGTSAKLSATLFLLTLGLNLWAIRRRPR